MDRISVTDETLRNVYVILQRLDETSDTITNKCEQDLLAQMSGLDTNFRKEVQKYIEAINTLKEKLKYCVDENMSAVSERISKLPDYENQTYKKRNII